MLQYYYSTATVPLQYYLSPPFCKTREMKKKKKKKKKKCIRQTQVSAESKRHLRYNQRSWWIDVPFLQLLYNLHTAFISHKVHRFHTHLCVSHIWIDRKKAIWIEELHGLSKSNTNNLLFFLTLIKFPLNYLSPKNKVSSKASQKVDKKAK